MSTTQTEYPVPSVVEETPADTGIDFMGAVMSRKFMVVVLTGIGIALGHLHYTRQAPVYASFAKVMVLRPENALGNGPNEQGPRGKATGAIDLLQNHQYLLTQPKILGDAVNPAVRKEAALREEEKAKRIADRERLIEELQKSLHEEEDGLSALNLQQAEARAALAEIAAQIPAQIPLKSNQEYLEAQLKAKQRLSELENKIRLAEAHVKRAQRRLGDQIKLNAVDAEFDRKLQEDADRLVDVTKLPTLASAAKPEVNIAQGLRVMRSDISDDVLEISYVGPNMGDCDKILNAVLASYQRWLRSTQNSSQQEMLEILASAKDTLQQKMTELQEEYSEFRQTARLLFQDNKGVNYFEQRLAKIESERHSKQLALGELEVQLKAMTGAQERGISKEALLLMANMLRPQENDKNSGKDAAGGTGAIPTQKMDPFMAQLTPLLVERETLLEQYGAGHPQIKLLDRKIDSLRIFLQEAVANGSTTEAAAPPKDLLETYMESLRERIAAHKSELSALETMFGEETNNARRLQEEMAEDRKYAERNNQMKQLFDAIVSKLLALDANKAASGMRATVTSEPTPGVQIGPNMTQSLGFGGVGGLIAAVAIALLLETADKSFRNPDEISKQLKLPVIGHIPELDSDRDWKMVKDAKVDSSISVHHRPRSRLAESYRAVRAAIFFGTRGQTHRVLQVTSANSGDGKTTLSCNLASAIAMSGKRTLLVDCDLRRPRVHKLFGLTLDVGVSSVIRDGMEIPDAIQTTLVPNLDVMTIGPRVENPAELLLSPQFTDLVTQLREKYDFVLMDTPPILIVTDPAAVAAHVDGVILVVRNTKRSRPQTRRVRETLDLIGARVLGVVVNGISERAAGYGYGDSYSYNYTTSYRSRSGGSYTDERVGHAYYDESRSRR